VSNCRSQPDAGSFRGAIEFDVIANQPTCRFGDVAVQNILAPRAALLLYHRSKTPLGAHVRLPVQVNQMLYYVCGKLDVFDAVRKEELRRTLCDNLARIADGGAITRVLRDGHLNERAYWMPEFMRVLRDDLAREEKIISSLCVEHPDLLQEHMEELGKYDCHALFSDPLTTAVTLSLEGPIKQMIQHFQTIMSKHEWGVGPFGLVLMRSGFNMQNAIEAACRHNHVSILQEIVAWVNSDGYLYRYARHQGILPSVVFHVSPEILDVLMKQAYGHDQFLAPYVRAHAQLASSSGCNDIIREFLLGGMLDEHKRKDICLVGPVQEGQTVVVQTLLNAGADPNSTSLMAKLCITVIIMAMARCWYEIIKILVDAGAEIPHVSIWPQHQETYEVLQQALLMRRGKTVPDFEKRSKIRRI
jgi:hypothetical protein